MAIFLQYSTHVSNDNSIIQWNHQLGCKERLLGNINNERTDVLRRCLLRFCLQ